MHLLLIEDDPTMQTTLQRTLRRRGMEVTPITDGGAALPAWRRLAPDAVVLDLSLPTMDGLEIIAKARSEGLSTPTLILTARGTVGDRILGLNSGADDYLAKPFDLDELEARIRALVRRAQPQVTEAAVPAANAGMALRYDKASESFYWQGRLFELTPREVAFLRVLSQSMGQAVTKERLFGAVFAEESDVQLEAVEVVAYRLRKKLAPTHMQLMTLRGLGYLLKPGAADVA
ncbi:response regulator transcription factor [Comamonas piscis]|uniref:Response regulator transcription factor n=1 Tax=Comamonas piscis TaxID=1562974 RepID=A0A7G5ENV5_9BURK|nr:response regulator transcription factor [Comamonas piscis]QMV75680.1 response regulator transcription factor [Comamonas piscis]WSO36296.1 response regulator transcription factor [Comamonas piscis]